MHAAAFRKFGLLDNFAFVLDGDRRQSDLAPIIRESAESPRIPILYLPGKHTPKFWIWKRLQRATGVYAADLGSDSTSLGQEVRRLDALYSAATDTESAIAKNKLHNLADAQNRTVPEVCRLIARIEAADEGRELQRLVDDLKDLLSKWRAD